MAETLSGPSLGEALANLIKRLSADPSLAGKSPEEIKQLAQQRVKEKLEARADDVKRRANERIANQAKKWADKVKGNVDKSRQEALSEVEPAKYPAGVELNVANERLAQTEAVLNTKTPVWIKTDIQKCPEAVELIARVTQLPLDLQNDPNVLYLELAKFNKSMKWSEAPPEARKEARVIQDKVLVQIRAVAGHDPTFGNVSREALLAVVDPNRIHLKTVPDSASGGEQTKHLQDAVDEYQEYFDLPVNQGAENQREQLEQLVKDLRAGSIGGNAQYNRKEAMEYIVSVQERINTLNIHLAQQREKQYGEVITLGELRKSDWFVGNKLSKTTEKMGDEVAVRFGQHWTKQDVDYLREKGFEKWFYRYVDRVFGLGMERKQPSLAQQYIYEDFQNFLITIYGGNEATNFLTRFQTLWEERSRYDYIVHSLGLGSGDMKRRLEAMSMLQSSDLDYLNTFTYSELANTFMERETFGLMGEKMAEYEKNVKWLGEEVKNDFHKDIKNHGEKAELVKKLKILYPKESAEEIGKIEKLVELYGKENLSRKEYLKVLSAEKIVQNDSGTFAQRGHRRMLEEIQLASDQVARGVVLEDIDVWGYSDIEIHMVKVSEEIERLKQGRLGGKDNRIKLSDDEINHYDEYVNELKAREQRLLQKKLAKIQEMEPGWKDVEDRAKLLDDLANRKGLSHIEVRVYERMREYLKAKTGTEPDEMELRQAIWAARTEIIGTGRMAAIGAMMARAPSSGMETASGKNVMIAPAFEDLVRAMNVEMFASRFSIGGKMGEVVRAYLRFNLRKERIGEGMKETGIGKADSFFDTNEWKEMKHGIQDRKAKETARIMEFAEKDLGIKFSEILAPGFMATGGQFDGTSWRLDRGVLDEIKTYYLKLQEGKPRGGNARLDNQALAIRYLIADGPVARKQVLEKMMERTPTKFFNLLADQREDMMTRIGKRGAGFTIPDGEDREDWLNKTWYKFENALKYAETDLWRSKDEIFRNVNLATKDDFDRLVKPYLKDVSPADIEKYRKLINVIQGRLKEDISTQYRFPKAPEHEHPSGEVRVEPHRLEYKSYLDGLAQEKLPLTLSLDDFNWQDADMKTLGNLAFPRRTRDIGGMDAAKDIVLAFISNRDNILSPNDPKEVSKQLLALKGAINSYSPTETAERAVKQISRLIVEFNRDRSLWSLPGWLPGGKTIGLWLAEMDLRPDAPFRDKFGAATIKAVNKVGQATLGNLAKLSSKVAPVNAVLNWMMPGWKNFSEKPFEQWPHSIAEAISWSVRFTGPHGNRWNEIKIDEFLHTMQDMGLFTEHPEYAHDLRGEFKAGFSFKMAAQVRRYWWVIPLATIAMAAASSIEEDKKRGH